MLELNTCSWLTCIEYFIYQKMHRCKCNQQDSNSEESLSNALLSYPHGFYFLLKTKRKSDVLLINRKNIKTQTCNESPLVCL